MEDPTPRWWDFIFNIEHDMDLVFHEENALSYLNIKLQNGLIGNIWSICALLTK